MDNQYQSTPDGEQPLGSAGNSGYKTFRHVTTMLKTCVRVLVRVLSVDVRVRVYVYACGCVCAVLVSNPVGYTYIVQTLTL